MGVSHIASPTGISFPFHYSIKPVSSTLPSEAAERANWDQPSADIIAVGSRSGFLETLDLYLNALLHMVAATLIAEPYKRYQRHHSHLSTECP